MPIVTNTGVPARTLTNVNTFWVAANVMFDLETGATKQILLLVNKVEDATVFTREDANNYFNFVASRAKSIQWSIERPPTPLPPSPLYRAERYVIKGVQFV